MGNMKKQPSSQLIDELAEWCGKRPLRLCVLFGSQATGKAHPRSDVDLAIWPQLWNEVTNDEYF
jgi:predicted nucleotidyltransferase